MCIPKNWCHHLYSIWNCLRFFWSRFSPFSSIFLTVPLSQVWSDKPMFYSWLWIDAINRLYCYETFPNTRLKHPHDAVIVPLWANAAPILRTTFSCSNFQSICDVHHFLKCLPCLLVRALLGDGHPMPFWEFSLPFLVVVTSFRWPLECSSWQLVRIRLNSATQYFIIVKEGADSPRVEST